MPSTRAAMEGARVLRKYVSRASEVLGSQMGNLYYFCGIINRQLRLLYTFNSTTSHTSTTHETHTHTARLHFFIIHTMTRITHDSTHTLFAKSTFPFSIQLVLHLIFILASPIHRVLGVYRPLHSPRPSVAIDSSVTDGPRHGRPTGTPRR